MKTPITEAISAADMRGSYLTNTEMQAIFGRFNRANAGLKAAKAFADNGPGWAEAAANHVYQKFPYTTQMQGPQYASTQEGKSKCVRDISNYLRVISYCCVVGGTGPLDEYVVAGVKEFNAALGLSPSWYVAALEFVRDNHGLSGDVAGEANIYLNYSINALS
ncbi:MULTISPECIES: phycocyanin subunit alpha [unclassified Coleofasciculus]|uniref:phycocyanin subunit alpha n=1 Tax=unclassified Coleofasciculus TaxID=2692782 RepID=UPI00187E3BB4|nr:MULTISPECIES: phycocyanin subunit alpha [unclassified Coleofasciculus]MBE9126419.1 phycocyanin subunit alpha [Coleofasciculus sp. LEGE 07081]MBE9148021.1 phycocyanin subunit alpha [Coleofasciculus sp. LEGE 07092]